MKCIITFRNLEHTDALDEKIRSKTEKLQKFFSPDASINWTCWIEKDTQIAEAIIKNKSESFVAKAESDSLYKTMDLVLTKIRNQVSHRH